VPYCACQHFPIDFSDACPESPLCIACFKLNAFHACSLYQDSTTTQSRQLSKHKGLSVCLSGHPGQAERRCVVPTSSRRMRENTKCRRRRERCHSPKTNTPPTCRGATTASHGKQGTNEWWCTRPYRQTNEWWRRQSRQIHYRRTRTAHTERCMTDTHRNTASQPAEHSFLSSPSHQKDTFWSHLACRIGHLASIWQPYIGSLFH
jgi:hypothetical protein